jgi:hypothetical protein
LQQVLLLRSNPTPAAAGRRGAIRTRDIDVTVGYDCTIYISFPPWPAADKVMLQLPGRCIRTSATHSSPLQIANRVRVPVPRLLG